MKFTKLTLAASLLVSASAFSADFKINTTPLGVDFDALITIVGNNDADRVTAAFDEFGFSQLLATSMYDFSDGSLLGDFVDTNIPTVLNSYGVTDGVSGTALDGVSTVTLNHPLEDSQTDIDALSPLTPPIDSDNEGYFGYYLDLEFLLNGTLSASGPKYTGGYIDFILVDTINDTRSSVMYADVTGSDLTLGNLNLFMDITSILDDFLWVDRNGNGNFVDVNDIVTNTGGFSMTLDTNVDPAFPTPDQLLVVNGNQGPQATRQARLDGSIGATPVPEPTSLALLAVGLLGLGMRSRKKSA